MTARAIAIAALVFAAPIAARAAAPDAGAVLALVEAWRFEEAEAAFAEFERAHPGEAAALWLEGSLRFHRGDYEGAADRMRAALAQAGRAAASLEQWRGFAKLVEDTAEATHDFAEAKSPDGAFRVRYRPGRDEVLLPYAFEALSAARRAIGLDDLDAGALLADPIRVEIYPEVSDLAKVSTLTLDEIETSGTIAICKFNRLMIVSPRALVHGYPWLDTLAHELTHFILARLSRDEAPIWFHEGLAKFEERRWRGAGGEPQLTPTMEHLLASALGKGGRLITFDEMYPSMAKLPSQDDTALAFAEVFTVIEYLHQRKGLDGIREVIRRMRDGQGDARAVADVLGVGFAEFQRAWKAWLKGRKLRVRPGLQSTPLRFSRGKKGEDAVDDEAQQVAEGKARRHVRLGGMLRVRGRMMAAAAEYEKAQALVGPGHFVVASRLARTRLSLGEIDRAIAVATPVSELYPESSSAIALLGEAFWRKRDAEKAAPWLEEAIRINPFDPAPHCALAEIYAARAPRDPREQRERDACRLLAE